MTQNGEKEEIQGTSKASYHSYIIRTHCISLGKRIACVYISALHLNLPIFFYRIIAFELVNWQCQSIQKITYHLLSGLAKAKGGDDRGWRPHQESTIETHRRTSRFLTYSPHNALISYYKSDEPRTLRWYRTCLIPSGKIWEVVGRMHGKDRGLPLYFQAVILAASLKDRGIDYFRFLCLTLELALSTFTFHTRT